MCEMHRKVSDQSLCRVDVQADSKKAGNATHAVKAGMKRKNSEQCEEGAPPAVPDQDLGPRPNPMPVSHCPIAGAACLISLCPFIHKTSLCVKSDWGCLDGAKASRMSVTS